MRLSDRVQRAIYEKYVPRIETGEFTTRIERNKKGEERELREPALMPDPNVLWVGDLIDGLTVFIPELFADEYAEGGLSKTGRRKVKHVLADSAPSERARAYRHGVILWIQRSTWPRDEDGQPRKVALSAHVREATPGELLNSVVERRNEETGAVELVTPQYTDDGKLRGWAPVEPVIREDKRWGLHLLMRGDFLHFETRDRQGNLIVREFRLRPRGEGSSELTPERRTDMVSW